MKILVRSLLTKKYLNETGDWQPGSSSAYDFKSSDRATWFCSARNIMDAELVAEIGGAHAIFPYLGTHARAELSPMND